MMSNSTIREVNQPVYIENYSKKRCSLIFGVIGIIILFIVIFSYLIAYKTAINDKVDLTLEFFMSILKNEFVRWSFIIYALLFWSIFNCNICFIFLYNIVNCIILLVAVVIILIEPISSKWLYYCSQIIFTVFMYFIFAKNIKNEALKYELIFLIIIYFILSFLFYKSFILFIFFIILSSNISEVPIVLYDKTGIKEISTDNFILVFSIKDNKILYVYAYCLFDVMSDKFQEYNELSKLSENEPIVVINCMGAAGLSKFYNKDIMKYIVDYKRNQSMYITVKYARDFNLANEMQMHSIMNLMNKNDISVLLSRALDELVKIKVNNLNITNHISFNSL